MNRQARIAITLLVGFFGTFFISAPTKSALAAKTERPNILFIMTDQQSAHMMSAAGNEHLDTPAMDRLAKGGVRFEQAYAANPVCVPSRFSLMTGRMPSAIGMRHNADRNNAVPANIRRHTMGRLFQKAGYKLAYAGRNHLSPDIEPERMGFEVLTENQRGKCARTAADFLKRDHEKPFLLFAAFVNPHDICYMAINAYRRARGEKAPYDNRDAKVLKKVLAKARGSGDLKQFVKEHAPPLPANHVVSDNEPAYITDGYIRDRPFRRYVRRNWSKTQWRLHRWAYARLTERVDQRVGTVLDALRETGLSENTLIVFTSDHGDHDAGHKLEHKSILYEEAARIPLIIRWDGHIPGGRVDRRHLVSNGLDLLPTLCDYAGIEIPDQLPGRSLRPLLKPGKRGGDVAWRDQLVVESRFGRMLRTDRYKYVVYREGAPREQLFDLHRDPGETDNLAASAEHRSVLVEHRRRLADWVRRIDDDIAASYIIPPRSLDPSINP